MRAGLSPTASGRLPLDGATGGRHRELRRRLGRQNGHHLPAIVITADRSLHVREETRAEGAHLLNKPLKPASLRALITQCGCREWRRSKVIRRPPRLATLALRMTGPRHLRPLAGFDLAGGYDGLGAALDAELLQDAETCAFTVASETPSS